MKKGKRAGAPDDDEDEPTHFITVDLEVYSRRRLAVLAAALGRHLSVHYEGREEPGYYAATFGGRGFQWVRGRDKCLTPDEEIRGLVRLVKRLPPAARELWAGAQRRLFDIGIQGGHEPYAYPLTLATRTLEQVAGVGGTIAVTVYAATVPSTKRRSRNVAGRRTMK
jgi:hypothetical protein